MPPPLLFFPILIAGVGIDRLCPWAMPFETLESRGIVAGPVLMLSAALGAWSIVTLRRAGTAVDVGETPRTLVTRGPYRLSRNPLYLALGGVLAGFAVLANTTWVMIGVALLVILLDRYTVRPEEAHLREVFPGDYEAYARKVRRWI